MNVSVVGSGRNKVDVDVELVQGTHSERLIHLRVSGNNLAFFDPRPRYGSGSVVLTSEMLSRISTGRCPLCAVVGLDVRSGAEPHLHRARDRRGDSAVA